MTKTSKKQVQDFILDGLNKGAVEGAVEGAFDGPETDVIEEAVGHRFPDVDAEQIRQLVEETVAARGETDHDPDSEDDDPAEDGDANEWGEDDEDDARDED